MPTISRPYGKDPGVLHDVVSAIYRGAYLIELEFDDGQSGTVDFAGYLERRGVFERFRDLEFFRSFAINKELGVLTWSDEIDIAPETLYAEATGTDLPGWMKSLGSGCGNSTVERFKQPLAVSAPRLHLVRIDPLQQIARVPDLEVPPFARAPRCSVQPAHQISL